MDPPIKTAAKMGSNRISGLEENLSSVSVKEIIE